MTGLTSLSTKYSQWPLALAGVLAVLLCCLTGGSQALNCYQGQQNASMPVQGSPMACPMASLSCIKSVDPSMNLASRACQTTNCTVSPSLIGVSFPSPSSTNSSSSSSSNSTSISVGFAQVNNVVSATAVCQNATTYPYQTYCCCYGDGCNSAMGLSGGTLMQRLLFGLLAAAVPLASARLLFHHSGSA